MDAIRSIVNYLQITTWPPKTLKHLLLVYLILDPARIPTEVSEDAATPPDLALFALDGLDLLGEVDLVALKAGTEIWSPLWSRAWAWLRFFDQWESLGWTVCAQRLPRITLRLIHALSVHEPTHDTIVSTQGALRIFGKSWRCVLEQPLNDLRSSIGTVRFLDHPQLRPHHSRLSELVDGVGSSEDLAALILHHLRISSRADGPFAAAEIGNLAHLVSFVSLFDCWVLGCDIYDAGLADADRDALSSHSLLFVPDSRAFGVTLTELGRALVTGRIVDSLSDALRKFAISFGGALDLTVDRLRDRACGLTCTLLYFVLTSCEGLTRLPRAIARGYLGSLMALSLTPPIGCHTLPLTIILFKVDLPPALSWHSVLFAVNGVWPDILAIASSAAFRRSSVWHYLWEPVRALVTDRLAAFDRYNSGNHSPQKMCGNVSVCATARCVCVSPVHSAACWRRSTDFDAAAGARRSTTAPPHARGPTGAPGNTERTVPSIAHGRTTFQVTDLVRAPQTADSFQGSGRETATSCVPLWITTGPASDWTCWRDS